MMSWEGFVRQLDSVEGLARQGIGPAVVFALGACYANTGVEVLTLFPFVEEVQTAVKGAEISAEEVVKIQFEIALGALGNARELIREIKARKLESDGNRCCLCGEATACEAVCGISRWCSHKFHKNCAQAAVQQAINQGEGQELNCPAPNCAVQLTQDELLALFSSEQYSEMLTLLSMPKPRSQVYCPTFHCYSQSPWSPGQFFSCETCKKSYCLHCLALLHLSDQSHECKPYDEECLSIAEMFTKGTKFKVCEKCLYWCDLTVGRIVVCRCGVEICAVCEETKKNCRCLAVLVKRPIDWLGSLFI